MINNLFYNKIWNHLFVSLNIGQIIVYDNNYDQLHVIADNTVFVQGMIIDTPNGLLSTYGTDG